MSEAFILLVDLAIRRGHTNIMGQVVRLDIDGTWAAVINGDKVARNHVPPVHAAIEYNGFPAGIIGPNAGILAAGALANEDALITALLAAGAELPAGGGENDE